MAIVICLAAALLPLLIAPGVSFYFDVTPKVLVLLACAIAALLAGLRQHIEFRSLFPIAMTSQISALLAATVFSTHPALSLSGTAWRRFGCVTQLALLVFMILAAGAFSRKPALVALLLRTAALAGGAIALYAAFQYFGLDPLIPPSTYRAGEGVFTIVRPPGTLGHANYLAAYLLFVVFAGWALATGSAGIWRLLGAASGGCAAFAVFLTGSRAALLGLAAGALWLWLRTRPLFGKRALVAAAGLALAVGLFLVSPPGSALRARAYWAAQDWRGGARLPLWRDAVRMAAHRQPFGYGPETFGAEFPAFQSVELARAYPDFYHESPHNIFLDTLDDQGIFGLAGLAATSALGLSLAWKARQGQRAFLGAALAAMLVCLQFSAFTLPTAFFVYLAIALLAGGSEAHLLPLRAHRGAAPAIDALAGARKYSAPIAALILVGLFGWFGARLAVADWKLAATRRAIGHGNLPAALRDYAAVLRWEPPGTSADLYFSRSLAQFSARESSPLPAALAGTEAMSAARRACAFPDERQNSCYSLAELYAAANDAPRTEISLRAAIAASPNWFKPHWALARLLQMTGRRSEASLEAQTAVNLDGGKHQEVTRSLQQIQAAGSP